MTIAAQLSSIHEAVRLLRVLFQQAGKLEALELEAEAGFERVLDSGIGEMRMSASTRELLEPFFRDVYPGRVHGATLGAVIGVHRRCLELSADRIALEALARRLGM